MSTGAFHHQSSFNCDVCYYTYSFLVSSKMYHLFVPLLLLASAAGDGNFSFTDTHVIVSEEPFTQARFGIARTGGQAQSVTLTCQVGNNYQ